MESKLINITDLSEYLGIPVNTLRSWVWQERIPSYRLGRNLRFARDEIDQWLSKHKKERNPKWEVIDD